MHAFNRNTQGAEMIKIGHVRVDGSGYGGRGDDDSEDVNDYNDKELW